MNARDTAISFLVFAFFFFLLVVSELSLRPSVLLTTLPKPGLLALPCTALQ
jgi:hypothetical protein